MITFNHINIMALSNLCFLSQKMFIIFVLKKTTKYVKYIAKPRNEYNRPLYSRQPNK